MARIVSTDSTRPGIRRQKRPSRKLTYNDQRELDTLTKSIPRLERQRDRLTAELDAVSGDASRVLELSQELATALQSIDIAETRWLELTEKAESLEHDPL